jgi:hypothetical protein
VSTNLEYLLWVAGAVALMPFVLGGIALLVDWLRGDL